MSTVSSVPTRRHRAELPAGAPASRGFRADVQALRALAVLLVILHHAGVPGVRAGYVGVDVFFVISGFLITAHLVGEATRTGRVRFAAFYARRIRRLLPAALLVVLGTVAAALLTGSPAKVADAAVHAWFTTFYGLNYRLAAEGVDHQNATAAPSPLQHYWSLAVEEQFYLLWPLLIVVALWVARRAGRPALPAVVATVTALSLAASVHLTATSPTVSYFALHTRAWELGAGALLALGSARLARVPRRVAAAASWAGFAAIAASAAAYSDATAFPGSAALLPVGGAALVIAAGCGGQVASVTRALGGRPGPCGGPGRGAGRPAGGLDHAAGAERPDPRRVAGPRRRAGHPHQRAALHGGPPRGRAGALRLRRPRRREDRGALRRQPHGAVAARLRPGRQGRRVEGGELDEVLVPALGPPGPAARPARPGVRGVRGVARRHPAAHRGDAPGPRGGHPER